MFLRMFRPDPTKTRAKVVVAVVMELVDLAGWRKNMTRERLTTSALLIMWGSSLMWDPEQKDSVLDEALKIAFRHRTQTAANALYNDMLILYEKLKFGPLHDRCCHKMALRIGEQDAAHLQELVRDTLPSLEVEAAAALYRTAGPLKAAS